MGKYLITMKKVSNIKRNIKRMETRQHITSPRTRLLFMIFVIVVLLMSFQMIDISRSAIYHTPSKSDCKPSREFNIPDFENLRNDIFILNKNAHDKLEHDIMMSFMKWNSLHDGKSKLKQSRMLSEYTYQVPHETKLTSEYWKRNWKDFLQLDYQAYMYVENFEKTCEKYDGWDMVSTRRGVPGATVTTRGVPGATVTTLCPCVPGTLGGHIKPDIDYLKSVTWNMTLSLARTVYFGGYWKPEDCIARRRVAVIIPCRDREMHLRAFLVHTHPLLQRQLLEYRIFVVEQNWPTLFNKASTMNAGFMEATKLFKFDCVVFHDVDLLSEDDTSIIHCGAAPVHYGAHLDVWNYTYNYKFYGGAISFTSEQFIKTNGFSKQYSGLDGQGDEMDLSGSVRRKKLNFAEGLTTVKYEIEDIYLEPLYTLVKINLNVKERSTKTFEKHEVHNYFKVRGGCYNPSILNELSLSLMSCRYYCHLVADCKAFLYYERKEIHCVHLNAICSINYGMPDVTVYIKDVNDDRYFLHFNNSIHYRFVPGTCRGNDLRPLNGTFTDCM